MIHGRGWRTLWGDGGLRVFAFFKHRISKMFFFSVVTCCYIMLHPSNLLGDVQKKWLLTSQFCLTINRSIPLLADSSSQNCALRTSLPAELEDCLPRHLGPRYESHHGKVIWGNGFLSSLDFKNTWTKVISKGGTFLSMFTSFYIAQYQMDEISPKSHKCPSTNHLPRCATSLLVYKGPLDVLEMNLNVQCPKLQPIGQFLT